MAIFICNADGCRNQGRVYDFGDEPFTTAECGGCGIVLEDSSTNE